MKLFAKIAENRQDTELPRSKYVGVTSCLGAFVVFFLSLGVSQPARFSFEKEGRFIAPEQRLGLGTVHSYRDSYDGPQPFDVLSYKLDISLAMTNESLQGRSFMTMRLKENVDSLVLNSVSLTLDTIRVDDVLKTVRIDSTRESVTINLNGRRNAGDTLRIDIAYRRLPEIRRPGSRKGYYFFRDTIGLPSNIGYTFSEPSDARFWFPCYDEPWDKATAEINITVPAGYVAASNGKLVGTSHNGNGTVTWRWKEQNQITTYLMCMTVSAYSISSLPYIKTTGDTIPLQYYVWNAPPFVDSAWTTPFLPTVRQMMTAFSGRFGEYKFDKYGMTSVIPFGYLGMEHQTLTSMNRYYLTSHRVVSHELAHQWWGDEVSPGTWADIWLNESFATYSEALWREHLYGLDSLKAYMRDTLQEFQFSSWSGAIYNPIAQGFDLFTRAVYTKGGWVLHTLRGAIGDFSFYQSLRAYRNKWSGRSAVTSEFAAVVDSVVGRDMSWFFNQWIYGKGWPKYASRYTWAADTILLTIQQQQDVTWPVFKMPMHVRAYYGTSRADYIVNDSLRTQLFRLRLTTPPDSVVLDPEGWILKQIVAPTSVEETENTSAEFRLFQNYPNPFNPTTEIRYQISEAGHVSIKVFDLLGREVVTLINEVKPEGTYSRQFDASNLSSGVYYYRLQAGSFIETKKMLLVK